MKVKEISCRYALSPSGLPGYDYALNPYRGCAHGCIYCYAPDIIREKREWGRFVDVKRNMPNVLARELRTRKRGVVGISTVTDPYQPPEKWLELTRHSLEQLLKRDFPICIQTKSDLVLRDLDLICRFSDAEVGFTIAFLDERMRELFEPNTVALERRLEAISKLKREGVKTWAFVGPILPHIPEKKFTELGRVLARADVDYVLVDKLNLKRNTRRNILRGLKGEKELSAFYSRMVDDRDSYRKLGRAIIKEVTSEGIPAEFIF